MKKRTLQLETYPRNVCLDYHSSLIHVQLPHFVRDCSVPSQTELLVLLFLSQVRTEISVGLQAFTLCLAGAESIWRSSALFIPFPLPFRPYEEGAYVIVEGFPGAPALGWRNPSWSGSLSFFFFNSLVFVSPDLDLCKINTRPLHSTSQLRTSPSISMSQVSNTWQALGQGGGYYKQKNHFTCSLCFVPVMLVFIMSLVRWQVGVSANTNQKTGKAVWKAQSVAANQWHWFEILLYSVFEIFLSRRWRN